MTSPVPADPPLDQFVRSLLRCGLYPREEMKSILRGVPSSRRSTSRNLADTLVEQKILTHFQAGKLLKDRKSVV